MTTAFERREMESWTNINGPTPAWAKGWNRPDPSSTSPHGLASRYLATVAFFGAFHREASYRVLFVAPATFGDEVSAQLARALDDVGDATAISYDSEAVAISQQSGQDIAHLVDEIRNWLNLTYDEISQMSGVSRSSIFNWKDQGRIPRATSVRSIQRLHSIAQLVVLRFGLDGAMRWLHAGNSKPYDRLMAADIDGLEDDLRSSLFRQPDLVPEEMNSIGRPDTIELTGEAKPPKRSSRTPRRSR